MELIFCCSGVTINNKCLSYLVGKKLMSATGKNSAKLRGSGMLWKDLF